MIGRRASRLALAVLAIVATATLALWSMGPPCLMGCDSIATGAEAHARLQALLPAPLPDVVEVTHMLEGGFQDRFTQIRLRAPETALPTLLSLFGADFEALTPARDRPIGASAVPWWPQSGQPRMRDVSGSLTEYHYARIAVAPDPDRPGSVLVFVFASQI